LKPLDHGWTNALAKTDGELTPTNWPETDTAAPKGVV